MRGGVITAGGYSTRFGESDKALAQIDSTPMLRHVADRLAPVIDTLVVNGRFDQLDTFAEAMDGYPHPVAYAADEHEGRGPVDGIATGLAALDPTIEHAVVVACDMPGVDPTVLDALFMRATTSHADAIVPRTDDGWLQVLHAVYRPRPMIDAARRALVDEERKVLAPLDHLDVEIVDAGELPSLAASCANVNTRDELDAIERRLTE